MTYCLQDDAATNFDLTGTDFDNTMTSWWCGKNVAYRFCNGSLTDDCSGDEGQSGAGSGRNYSITNNDDVSSIYLWPYNPLMLGAVTLFRDASCSDASAVFFSAPTALQKKSYVLSDMEAQGFEDDAATSMMIPYGVSVDLYSGDGFSGDKYTVVGPFYADETL